MLSAPRCRQHSSLFKQGIRRRQQRSVMLNDRRLRMVPLPICSHESEDSIRSKVPGHSLVCTERDDCVQISSSMNFVGRTIRSSTDSIGDKAILGDSCCALLQPFCNKLSSLFRISIARAIFKTPSLSLPLSCLFWCQQVQHN